MDLMRMFENDPISDFICYFVIRFVIQTVAQKEGMQKPRCQGSACLINPKMYSIPVL